MCKQSKLITELRLSLGGLELEASTQKGFEAHLFTFRDPVSEAIQILYIFFFLLLKASLEVFSRLLKSF